MGAGRGHSNVMPVFPFIVGCGRSGTTLLRAFFDSHPRFTIPGESRFIPAVAAKRESYETGGGVVDRLVADLAANEWFANWRIDVDDAREAIVASEAEDLPGGLRALFALHAERAGKPRYGDKSPQYVMHLPTIAALFPEARFLHIVRDGRDVALAFRDAPFGLDDVGELALHWRQRVERGRRGGAPLGPRYREVRYEQLVADTEPLVRDLCEYVRIDFEPTMLEYYARRDDLLRHSPSPSSQRSLALPPTVGLRDWRNDMATDDVTTFELLAGDVLVDFGYELSGRKPTAKARAAAARATLRWNARRARRRLAKLRLTSSTGAA
jgi:hypothetical protein